MLAAKRGDVIVSVACAARAGVGKAYMEDPMAIPLEPRERMVPLLSEVGEPLRESVKPSIPTTEGLRGVKVFVPAIKGEIAPDLLAPAAAVAIGKVDEPKTRVEADGASE